MNRNAIAIGVLLAASSPAFAGAVIGNGSIFIDVLAVNGEAAEGVGMTDTVGVQQGDTILFGINGTLTEPIEDDFIQFAIIRLASVGAFGTVDPDSITLAPALQGIISNPTVFDDNGLDLQTFRLPGNPDNSLGTSGQLFTFEFVVTADDGQFAYDALVEPGPNDPANRLVAGAPDFNKYLLSAPKSDLIVIPAPGAALALGVIGLAGVTRRRR